MPLVPSARAAGDLRLRRSRGDGRRGVGALAPGSRVARAAASGRRRAASVPFPTRRSRRAPRRGLCARSAARSSATTGAGVAPRRRRRRLHLRHRDRRDGARSRRPRLGSLACAADGGCRPIAHGSRCTSSESANATSSKRGSAFHATSLEPGRALVRLEVGAEEIISRRRLAVDELRRVRRLAGRAQRRLIDRHVVRSSCTPSRRPSCPLGPTVTSTSPKRRPVRDPSRIPDSPAARRWSPSLRRSDSRRQASASPPARRSPVAVARPCGAPFSMPVFGWLTCSPSIRPRFARW